MKKGIILSLISISAILFSYRENSKLNEELKVNNNKIRLQNEKTKLDSVSIHNLKRKADSLTLEITRGRLDCTIEIQKALSYRGIRYKYGGINRNGIDCSGLVCVAANKKVSKRLFSLRSASKMFASLKSLKHPKKGSLVFFSWSGRKVDHVGIIIDKEKFIHSSSSRGVVLDNISKYKQKIIGYRYI